MILKEITPDVLVVGGGLAGCFAAIAAKRTNPSLEVWLVERYGHLGGMATAGYVYPFMKYYTTESTIKKKRLNGGLFKEMLDKMHKLGYCEKIAFVKDFYTRFDPMMIRCVLDKMVLDEEIHLLFHALINEVSTTSVDEKTEDNNQTESKKVIRIKQIVAQTKLGSIVFKPSMVIDGTGDADVVYHAGGLVEKGRSEDGLTQPGTLNFRMGNVSRFASKRRQITKKIKEEKKKGNLLTPRDDCLMFIGKNSKEWHFNQTRVAGFDFTDPFEMTSAELEGREQTERFIQFLRTMIKGFKRSSVMNIGSQLGIRESRRIVGEYVLNEDDILHGTKFEDRIALGNYPIDIHDPKGTAKTTIIRCPPGDWYSIPYRSLIPINVSNCLVVGRPISSTHEAHSALRVMSVCSCIGQAAGVALGLISLTNSQISEKRDKMVTKDNYVNVRSVNVEKLQNLLRNQDAVLD